MMAESIGGPYVSPGGCKRQLKRPSRYTAPARRKHGVLLLLSLGTIWLTSSCVLLPNTVSASASHQSFLPGFRVPWRLCLCITLLVAAVVAVATFVQRRKQALNRTIALPKMVNKKEYQQLLEHYTLGKVLGQGAFGVVYLCKSKKDSKEYAVKMIDKVESPLDDIKREVQMLKDLAHERVIKLVDTYFEKVFVCMVMEIYRGGDLIEGMQHHWKTVGVIPCSSMKHIALQMLQAIEYCHQKECVHRDIKGDNYLLDRKDIVDPQCLIYLSDFGTVTKIKTGERLTSSCGTQIYWPPEFYDYNYAEKVDVWAVGVVMYGLVEGKFPFKGEADARKKKINLPSRCPDELKEFILGLLQKKEAERSSASQGLAAKWFGSAVQKEDMSGVVQEFEVKEAAPNAGVAERRRQLVERLEEAKQGQGASAQGAFSLQQYWADPKFQVKNKHKNIDVTYEWWTPAKVKSGNVLDEAKANALKDDDDNAIKAMRETVKKNLQDHGVDIKNFGTGKWKTVEQLADEVRLGQSRLMLDASSHKKLVRVADLVLVRLKLGSAKDLRYVVQTGETFADGRTTQKLALPGGKKEPYENTMDAAKRLLKDRMQVEADTLKFNFTSREVFEEETESQGYPGVRTLYRTEIVEADVVGGDIDGKKGDWSVEDSNKVKRNYKIMSMMEADEKRLRYKAPPQQEVSAIVHAPIGLNETDLVKYLTDNNVDVTQFGKNDTRSLKDFSTELITGEATLQRQVIDGVDKVVRVVEVIILKVLKQQGQDEMVLVQMSQSTAQDAKIPAVKCRPDENQFLAARRVLERELRIDANYVTIQPDKVKLVEETSSSRNYPGLETKYKKRIITAILVAKDTVL